MIDFYLYADPTDGLSTQLIPIISKQFPTAELCKTLSDVNEKVQNSTTPVVLFIPRTSGALHPVETTIKIWVDEIRMLTNNGIQVVLFLTEIEFINLHNKELSRIPNLLIVTPGQHTFGTINYPYLTWQHWLQDAVDAFNQPGLQNYIDTFDPLSTKPMLFDALLGGERPYRTLIHDWIEEDPVLSPKTIMTYYGGKTTRPKMLFEPGMDAVITDGFHTGKEILFNGVRTRISVVPPVSVYQHCAYSLVTETTAEHNYVFFTEKITRPIVCRRLFIVVSSYGYLHYLRQSGFKTFGDIIDESYDLEINNEQRWRMAFEQMQALAKLDQQQVLAAIRPITEHNQRVMLETDWHKTMSNRVNQILNAKVNLKINNRIA